MQQSYYGGMFVSAYPEARNNVPGFQVTYVDFGNKQVWLPADFFNRFFKACPA